MRNNMPDYKGYHAKVEFDFESMILHGKIIGIDDLVTFESKTVNGIIDEFHSAVDDYLEFCEEIGKRPCKEYKGSFNVRINPDLHKKLSYIAESNNKSMNNCIEDAIERFVHDKTISSCAEVQFSLAGQYTTPSFSWSGKTSITPIVEAS